MRPNRFKELLGQGKMPVGHMLGEFSSRGVARILEAAGVDFAVLDMEHGAFTLAELADIVAWLKATPVTPFVRVAQPQYHLIARALDVGAMGISVPNVKSAAEARTVVDAARYPPLGKRGLHFSGASSDFEPMEGSRHIEWSNENITVICMIESPEGVDDVEGIAATPGVDALWVGQWDLTQYLGIPGDFHDKRFLDAAKKVVDAAARHGQASIIQPGDLTQLREFLKLGFSVMSCGIDFAVYREALTKAIIDVRKEVGR